ncbi:MAG: ABC transporter permease [Ginsengibacter sp.]
MFKNYFKIAWRSLWKKKAFSFINIVGLAAGMAVVMLIGLWIWSETSFNKGFQNYNSIAQVMQNQSINNVYQTQEALPIPIAEEMRVKYGSDFKQIILSTATQDHIFSFGEKKIENKGNFMEPQAPEMFTLKMLAGSRNGLNDIHSILLSSTLSKSLFGDKQAIGQTILMDDTLAVKVSGVYADFSENTSFSDVKFLAAWQLFATIDLETKNSAHEWDDNGWKLYVQMADNADYEKVSAKIKNIKAEHSQFVKSDQAKPALFLFPMSKWHLYSDFKNGESVGGRIQYVKLFALIGFFVLLLACINFMNLSTALSEKRAKEVGIRKTLGSLRSQLVIQFFCESLFVSMIAFILSFALVQLSLPFFNKLADKNMMVPWQNIYVWLYGFAFSIITGLVAGSYPALYLSSFQPVKVLKGVIQSGRFASLPRKILVVTQFTVSIALIVGTVMIYRQVQFARSRSVGYSKDGLLRVDVHTKTIQEHFDAFRNDLLNTGTVGELAATSSPTTEMTNQQGNFSWDNKQPGQADNFATVGVTQQYAKTVGLQFIDGRDFRTPTTGNDKLTMILSESAAKGMGFKNPVGETIGWYGMKFTVIGVVRDIVMESPYKPAIPTIYFLAPWTVYTFNIRINPNVSAADALAKIKPLFSQYNPAEPFDYKFVDEEYDAKFKAEEKIGGLASFFAALAIFISCMGLFGLASFIAEQRRKEIGVRKVLGATVFSLWRLLSKEFAMLIMISFCIATPVAYYFMDNWLQNYEYRTTLSWWIFAAAGVGALMITLLTVSFQAIKAAIAKPVKSLRSE